MKTSSFLIASGIVCIVVSIISETITRRRTCSERDSESWSPQGMRRQKTLVEPVSDFRPGSSWRRSKNPVASSGGSVNILDSERNRFDRARHLFLPHGKKRGIDLGHRSHPSTRFGAAAAGVGACFHLCVIADLFAAFGAPRTHLGAGGAGLAMKV